MLITPVKSLGRFDLCFGFAKALSKALQSKRERLDGWMLDRKEEGKHYVISYACASMVWVSLGVAR